MFLISSVPRARTLQECHPEGTGLGAPVPENAAFPRADDTQGLGILACSVRHAHRCQLGKMISDSLSRPATSRATGADGSHQMSNKLSFLALYCGAPSSTVAASGSGP